MELLIELVPDDRRLDGGRLAPLKQALMDGRTVMVVDAHPLSPREKSNLRNWLRTRGFFLRLRRRVQGQLVWADRGPNIEPR
jgi:hypothetical protein